MGTIVKALKAKDRWTPKVIMRKGGQPVLVFNFERIPEGRPNDCVTDFMEEMKKEAIKKRRINMPLDECPAIIDGAMGSREMAILIKRDDMVRWYLRDQTDTTQQKKEPGARLAQREVLARREDGSPITLMETALHQLSGPAAPQAQVDRLLQTRFQLARSSHKPSELMLVELKLAADALYENERKVHVAWFAFAREGSTSPGFFSTKEEAFADLGSLPNSIVEAKTAQPLH